MNIYKIVTLSKEEYTIICTAHEAAQLIEKGKVISISFIDTLLDYAEAVDLKDPKGGEE